MGFFFFIVLNLLLLVRPEDLYPPIAGLRLYLVVIVLCTASVFPQLLQTLSRDSLRTRPIAVCVLGMLGATFLSFAFRARFVEGLEFCGEFAKVVLFYFLLVTVVNTPERLRTYVAWVATFVGCIMAISLLQLFEMAEFPGITPLRYNEYNPATGGEEMVERIVSVGLFSDPNDLCVIVAFGMALCLALAATSRGAIGTLLWLLPLVPMGYACTLTKSRGGMLAILAGVAATAFAKLGVRRSVPFLAVGLPVLLLGVGGRQGNIAGGGGTAHERLILWADGLGALLRMPFYLPTGLTPGFYVEEFGLLAHNSYINAYVELGLLGGGLFLTAFYTAARGVYSALRNPAAEPWAKASGPYLFGALATYAVGCYSLTRNFHIPTYLALGIVAVYIELAATHPATPTVVDQRWWQRLAVIAVLGLVFLKLATQLLGLAGV